MNLVVGFMVAYSMIVICFSLYGFFILWKRDELDIPHLMTFVALLIAVLVMFKIMFLGGFTL